MGTISVLLVDDDRDIREALCEILELEGHKVSTAENGLAAINYLKKCSPDERPCIIILDLAMPVMNGAEFRARQLQIPYLVHIPVVAMSADCCIKQRCGPLHLKNFLKLCLAC